MNSNNLKNNESLNLINLKNNNIQKKENDSLKWKDFEKKITNSRLFDFFSYRLNIDDVKNFYENQNLENACNSISKPILFNKKNKFIFAISTIYWIIYKLFTYSLIFGFLFSILYLLKNFTNLGYWSYTSIYYWIIVLLSLLNGSLLSYFDFVKLKSITKNWRKKRLHECAFVNMHIRTIAKMLYKTKNVINTNENKYIEDWKEFVNDLDDFYEIALIFMFHFGNFYNNKKIEIETDKKIKFYKNNKKAIYGKTEFCVIIMACYTSKFLYRFFIFLIFSSLVYIPISFV